MKEELLLKQRFGNQRPFKVPEGYFDSLEKSLMQNMPEDVSHKRSAKQVFMRPMRWVACFVAVLLVSGAIYFKGSGDNSDLSQTEAVSESMSPSVYADYILDEISDYAMLDNEDFYSYVTNE